MFKSVVGNHVDLYCDVYFSRSKSVYSEIRVKMQESAFHSRDVTVFSAV